MQKDYKPASCESAFMSSGLSDEPLSREASLFNKMEIKDIEGYSNYFITYDGKVYSRRYRNSYKCKELKQWISNKGYYMVCLTKKCKSRFIYVHRLVGKAFVPNPHNLPQINHINFNRTDNRPINLEWTNQSYNIKHAHNNGRVNTAKGENNGQHKLTESQVLEIRELYKLKKYTQVQLCEIYGITIGPMNFLLNRKNWRHI